MTKITTAKANFFGWGDIAYCRMTFADHTIRRYIKLSSVVVEA